MPQALVIFTDASGSGNAAYFPLKDKRLYKQVFPLLSMLSFRQLYWLVRTLPMFLSICIQIVHVFVVYLRLLKLLT
jgi:hypothetical protein